MTPEELQAVPLVRSLSVFPGAITDAVEQFGELTLIADPAQIIAISAHLKQKEGFERLVSITAVDWYPMEPRFEIVYHYHSIRTNRRLRIKCRLATGAEMETLTSIYRAADWYEREMFDMFGVSFRNHPNLKRILMPDDWEGHPLRKDYPIHGYKYSYKSE